MTIKVGDLVRFKCPTSPEEEVARFVVVEEANKMGRIKMRFICNLPIPPIELVEEGDVEKVC
jgi:hypothetical protein